MFWQEDERKTPYQVPDDVLDLLFDIQCREIPVDHAYSLSEALAEKLPAIKEDERIAVHSIHVAGSQNGWERPAHSPDQKLIVSRRTKLAIRVPKERIAEIQAALDGAQLDIDGCCLTIGKSKTRALSKQGTVFSRYVACEPGEDEEKFLQRIADELTKRGIRMRKALCGKTTAVRTPDGPLETRSLMLAGLSPEESVALQQQGVGPGRDLGMGIFLPHKGIDAVKQADDD